MDYRGFIRLTEREGALDGDMAERAARATLTTLAERIAPLPAAACDQRRLKRWDSTANTVTTTARTARPINGA